MDAWSIILAMAAGGMRTPAHGEMDEDAVRALPPAMMMCWGSCGPLECTWPLHTATMTRLTTRTPTSPRGASGATCSMTGPSTGGGAGGRCFNGRRSATYSKGLTPRYAGNCVLSSAINCAGPHHSCQMNCAHWSPSTRRWRGSLAQLKHGDTGAIEWSVWLRGGNSSTWPNAHPILQRQCLEPPPLRGCLVGYERAHPRSHDIDEPFTRSASHEYARCRIAKSSSDPGAIVSPIRGLP